MTALKQEKLLESNDLRNQLIERTEVLAKVKDLFLIPGLEMMTTRQVADFYEVEYKTIRTVFDRHKAEIQEDGVQMLSAPEIRKLQNEASKFITLPGKPGKTTYSIDGHIFEFNNAHNTMFSPRAILRIGMLLRDSEIAKEVRTQLLNTFETTTEQQRTESIDQEDKLLLAVLHAKDTATSVEALAEYKRFMDRHVAKLEAKVNDLEAQLDLVATGTLTWGSRPVANALVNSLAAASHAPIPYTWGRVFRQLRYALGICLENRKPQTASKISRIREDEWPSVLKLIASLAYEAGVDIPKCLNSINAEKLSS